MYYTENHAFASEIEWLIKLYSRVFTERFVPAGIVKECFAFLCNREIHYRVYEMLPSVPV